jgi:glycine hydroxymethyltransferase
MTDEFKAYGRQVVQNASALADELSQRGLRIVSGGTDNHLMLVDLNPINSTGRDAERALDEIGITVNKNAIPFDTKSPMVTSGLRLGSPAVTTRGFSEDDMRTVGRLIATVLTNPGNQPVADQVADEVRHLTSRFPVPGLRQAVRA